MVLSLKVGAQVPVGQVAVRSLVSCVVLVDLVLRIPVLRGEVSCCVLHELDVAGESTCGVEAAVGLRTVGLDDDGVDAVVVPQAFLARELVAAPVVQVNQIPHVDVGTGIVPGCVVNERNRRIRVRVDRADEVAAEVACLSIAEADEEGLNYWLSQMNNKDDGRYFIFCSFANSAEFKDICASYGINCGVFAKENVLKTGNETFYISPSGMYVRSEADITDSKGVTIHSEFVYDENGINIKRSNYVNGVLQEYIIYTYPSVDVMRCDVYDAKGNLTQYMITTYSGEQLQRVDFYTADGSFRGYITYDYSQGNTPVIHEYNADGVQVS